MSTIEVMPARLTREETEDLKRAIACLEGTSFAKRLTDAIGRPIGALSRNVPLPARRLVAHASKTALRGALKLALRTIDLKRAPKAGHRAHRLAAAASGALGGAFGLAALPVELPLSTTILLRSIAEIAREEGEDLSAPQAGLACVEVFAPSSTKMPTASASPPSVMTLIVSSSHDKSVSENKMASGISIRMITVERQLPRNRRIMTPTSAAASAASRMTPKTAALTKID